MSNPYELDDATYDLFIQALKYKMREEGTDATNLTEVLLLMKKYWGALTDPTLLQGYIDQQRLARLQASKATQEAALAEINQQISDIENP